MKSVLLGMLAETSIHPGAGRNNGFVDLPVAREGATDYPVIVGSSLKGALRDQARQAGWGHTEEEISQADIIFGRQDDAGDLLVSDARLLLLPVRSLNSHYKWVTCPHLIERLARDRRRAGGEASTLSSHSLKELHSDKHCALSSNSGEILFLEERQFSSTGTIDDSVVELISTLIPHPESRGRLASQLVVISDDDFTWFARYGLVINARNVLDPETKSSKNLWYEESIPTDSLFYAVLGERRKDALTATQKLFEDQAYLQVGGNATVGQGWFAIEWLDANANSTQGGI